MMQQQINKNELACLEKNLIAAPGNFFPKPSSKEGTILRLYLPAPISAKAACFAVTAGCGRQDQEGNNVTGKAFFWEGLHYCDIFRNAKKQ